MAKVKFLWNGLKVDRKLYRCSYSDGPYTETSGLPEGTITMYEKDYVSIPRIEGLNVSNDSDIMTDYFAKDVIRILPGSPFYKEAKEALKSSKIHNSQKVINYYEKMEKRYPGYYKERLATEKKKLEELLA